MTVHQSSRWPTSPEPDEDLLPKEVLESVPRSWPTALIAVLALLLGLGVGNVLFRDGRQLEETAARLEVASDRLDAANQEITRLRHEEFVRRLELERVTLAELDARRERDFLAADLDHTAVALAGLSDALSADFPAANPTAAAVIEQAMAAARAGDMTRFAAAFTRTGVITAYEPGLRLEWVGPELELVGRHPTLTLTDELTQAGDFVWTAYSDSESTGVLVFRLEDGRIAHQWVMAKPRRHPSPDAENQREEPAQRPR